MCWACYKASVVVVGDGGVRLCAPLILLRGEVFLSFNVAALNVSVHLKDMFAKC